ncbi:MAG TPA: 50S ribosomal protein L6 [Spirochaetia bacterium]|nr:50S ribosomal protein L6 [Spirochaetia bacterium]HUZ18680.1 50S ribosomal protein L6 [Spirochaetia bacterium]
MSRIGKLPVAIPKGVKVDIAGRHLSVEGPKGKLAREIDALVGVELSDGVAVVTRKNDSKRARAFHGLYRKLLYNMVTGVSTGFSKTLLINGVGFRAEVKGASLLLNLGYSNPIEYLFDKDIQIAVDQNKVIVSGADREKVGQVSAEIRSIRPPEPYKGKGVKYEDERIRRKVGKSGVK